MAFLHSIVLLENWLRNHSRGFKIGWIGAVASYSHSIATNDKWFSLCINSFLCEHPKSSQHKKYAWYFCIAMSVLLWFQCNWISKSVHFPFSVYIQFKSNYSSTEWSFFMWLLQHAMFLLSKQYTNSISCSHTKLRAYVSNRLCKQQDCDLLNLNYLLHFCSTINFYCWTKSRSTDSPLFFPRKSNGSRQKIVVHFISQTFKVPNNTNAKYTRWNG